MPYGPRWNADRTTSVVAAGIDAFRKRPDEKLRRLSQQSKGLWGN